MCFVQSAQQFAKVTRVGDPVLVKAPTGSMAQPYNAGPGQVVGFGQGGWIEVQLEGVGNRRFRADELLVL